MPPPPFASSPLQRRQSGEAMQTEGDEQLVQLARLQAAASGKHADFESRKRAGLTADDAKGADKGERWCGGVFWEMGGWTKTTPEAQLRPGRGLSGGRAKNNQCLG